MDIKKYAEIWVEFKTLMTAHLEAMKNLCAREIALRGCEGYLAATTVEEHAIERKIKDVAARFTEILCREAETQFSTPEIRVEINREEVMKSLGLDRDRTELDVLKFWAELEKRYGGDKGMELALQQNAAVIVSKFNLNQQTEVKISAGAVVLTKKVYTELDFSKNVELTYSCRDDLHMLLMSLSAFALSAGRVQLSQDLRKNPFSEYRYVVTSRERIPFGDNELELVTFNNKFEFRFAKAVADDLMVFIGTHHQQTLKQAA